ncbi:MAG: hypothetical protein CL889_01490 [Dehalococcoidia bacterium]|nr:hypothetical protein [Dehalococcoidia bacterium]
MNSLEDLVKPGSQPKRLNNSENFTFTEGPVWDNDSNLYFSDCPTHTTKVLRQSGQFETFRSQTRSGNGMALTHGGELLVCEGVGNKISAVDIQSKSVRTVVNEYNSLPLNAPNDLVLDRFGGIYFTDPVFTHAGSKPQQDAEAVYYVSHENEISRLWSGAYKPNGIVLRPDAESLLVADSFSNIIWCIELSAPGNSRNVYEWGHLEIPNKAYVYDMNGKEIFFPEYPDATLADGMALDTIGNLYVTTQLGIQVLDVKGNLIGILEFPEQPANCAFGGQDMQTLFVTAQTSIYSIDMSTKGLKLPLD